MLFDLTKFWRSKEWSFVETLFCFTCFKNCFSSLNSMSEFMYILSNFRDVHFDKYFFHIPRNIEQPLTYTYNVHVICVKKSKCYIGMWWYLQWYYSLCYRFVGTPVMILPNGPAPSNKKLVVLAEKLKPLIRDLIDHANMVNFCS